MIFEHDGKKYEFRGEYRYPQQGESFLNDTGDVMPHYPNMSGRIRAIIHPVPVTHTFGGVTFEETGKYRRADGEWVLEYNGARFFSEKSCGTYTILKRV